GSKSLFSESSILATVYENALDMKGLYPGWSKDIQFVRSGDFFQSGHEKVVPCGNQFEILSRKVFLGVASACPLDIHGAKKAHMPESADRASGVSLIVSDLDAITFHEACLPTPLR
ncbi:unnamed protein product, partial [Ostreobium quekettii]